ncbi:MAG: NAD-dependent epimerase/dehydratase family protein [Candidatus Baltobacteraceae bacterium]
MKVLVVGATGYIGRAVCEALASHGHRVLAMVRDSTPSRAHAGADVVRGDITDVASLVSAALNADAVVYAVQYHGEDGFAVESAALTALSDALARNKKRMLYTSGVWTYGSTFPNVANEETPPHPIAIVAKRPELENILLNSVANGLHAIVIRPGDVYGRGGGIPAMWVQSAHENGAARIIGDGTNHWPMIHIDDLASLYVLALEKAAAGSAYIAADETQLTVNAMAEAASRGAGKNGAVVHWPLEEARKAMGLFADALVLNQLVTSAKARRELQWSTRSSTAVDDLQAGSYVRA